MIRRIPLLLPLLALALSGCDVIDASLNAERIRGSGHVVQENRNVSGFDSVKLAAMGEMNLRQGDRESLTVEAEDNILPRIQTEVEGSTLVIRVERGVSISPSTTVRYSLTVKELANLELSGSGKIYAAPIKSREFSVRLPGSGEIRLDNLAANSLTASISGSGSIRIPGRVSSQQVRISGSGDYDGENLQSRTADISVSGSGDSRVWVQDELTASISGSGHIEYYGNPRISQHVSGSGRTRNAGDRP